ncbi:MAG: hypothetical protein RQ885_02905 [Desulfurococcales archaeon]|jgi:DNA helicase HerA-like ATPase|nr:hypothetical protein [Desulfurococcales archaeon]
MINKIMRLRGVRGFSCIMATYKHQDLNDLVIQQANTKITLRSEREALRRIDID